MAETFDLENAQEIIEYYRIYYRLANENLSSAKQIYDDNINSKKSKLEIAQLAESNTVSCVIFSALTIEAYINHFGVVSHNKMYEQHFEKMDLISKWVVFPSLIKEEIFMALDDFKVGKLKQLRKLRNELVHSKTQMIPFLNRDFNNHITLEDAKLGFSCIHDLVYSLEAFYPSIYFQIINI